MIATTAPRARRSSRLRLPALQTNVAGFVLAIVWLAIVVVPIYWMLISSFRPQAGFVTANQWLPPAAPTLDSYGRVIQDGFAGYLVNSVLLTVGSDLVAVTLALLAAYAVVRGRGRSRQGVFRLFLLGLAIPIQAVVIPIYMVIGQLGLYDTLLAVALPSIAFALPLSVLIFVSSLRDIPNELFEAMRADGAGNVRMLLSLVLPIARPAIATVGIYDALQIWNGFLFPLILTQSDETKVLPLALQNYQGQYGIDIPAVMAAVVLSGLPLFALYLFGRRQLVSGLSSGFGR